MLKYKDACAAMVNADVNRSKHKEGGDVRTKRAMGGSMLASTLNSPLVQSRIAAQQPPVPTFALKKGGKACKK